MPHMDGLPTYDEVMRQISKQVSLSEATDKGSCSFDCFFKFFIRYVSPFAMAVPMVCFGGGLLPYSCPESWIILWMLVQGLCILTVYLLYILYFIGKQNIFVKKLRIQTQT